jgi:hypothetical protein
MVRVSGVFALLFALFHIWIGVLGVTELGVLREAFEAIIQFAQDHNLKGSEGASPDAAILLAKMKIACLLVIGVASFTCGIALLFLRKWAPKTWFLTISVATLFYVVRLLLVAADHDAGVPDIGLTIVVAALLCLSWLTLRGAAKSPNHADDTSP